MRRLSPLLAIELLALVAWIATAAWFVTARDPSGTLVPLDPDALAAGDTTDTWMGIYFEGQKVGYAVSSETPTVGGGTLMRNRSAFEVAAFGEIKKVITLSNALVGADGAVQRFDLFMSSDPVRMTARGEVRPGEIVVELVQAGELQTLTLPIDEPPQMSLSLKKDVAMRGADLAVGQSWEVPYFDPATLMSQRMTLKVVDVEVLPDGEEAYWITRGFGDISTRVLMTTGGETIREEGAFGMALVRETREQAQDMPTGVEPVDIIGLSAVNLIGLIPEPRSTRALSMVITGVKPERVRNEPPLQVRTGDTVHVLIADLSQIPDGLPRAVKDEALSEFLDPTPFLPSNHRELQDKAIELVGDIDDRKQAARVLNDWVFGYLHKAPTIGVPNALEVLRVGQGDCNEHTALYVALARASGIPARIAAGLVYSDRISGRGGFYYHAWPREVLLGEQWVPVDPTFGQFPADATHVKLVEGDLDKQVEIMGVMGRIGFKLVEVQ